MSGFVASTVALLLLSQPVVPHGKLTRTVTVDGIAREYLVHVPASIDGATKVPVVFMLHGTTGDGQRFYDISGWVQKADVEGFIAVFPSSLTYCFWSDDNFDGVRQPGEYAVTSKWAEGALGTPALPMCTDDEFAKVPADKQALVQSRTAVDDVKFLRSIVTELKRDLPVDATRFYLSGFSSGGQMAARVAVDMSDIFVAVGVAGGRLNAPGTPPRKTPVLVSVGSRDELALAQTGVLSDPNDNLTELPMNETALTTAPVDGIVGGLATALGIDTSTHRYNALTLHGKPVVSFGFGNTIGTPGSMGVLILGDVTHMYPNGMTGTSGTNGSPIVMTEILWPFFKAATW